MISYGGFIRWHIILDLGEISIKIERAKLRRKKKGELVQILRIFLNVLHNFASHITVFIQATTAQGS